MQCNYYFQVRMRPYWAQWRYKLDILVNSRPIYFDRYPQKIQHFPGVTVSSIPFKRNTLNFHMKFQSETVYAFLIIFIIIFLQVYTPSQILNQSHIIMMFKSGAGVEVVENKHYMAARVFLPWEFIVSTSP